MTLHPATMPRDRPLIRCAFCKRAVAVYVTMDQGATVVAHKAHPTRLPCFGGGLFIPPAGFPERIVNGPIKPGRPSYLSCDADSGACPARHEASGPGTGHRTLRGAAMVLGWAHAPIGGGSVIDYCPAHAYRAEDR